MLTEGRRLLAKILQYMAPSILPSIGCSRSVPFAEKHPQSMMFPPPCFTVGMVFLGLYSSFYLLQTRRVEFIPKSYILVSSDHMTFPHASSGSSRWSLTNSGCCAVGCNLTSGTNALSKIKMFQFPKYQRPQAWITAVQREAWLPGMNSRICSTHFTGEAQLKFDLID